MSKPVVYLSGPDRLKADAAERLAAAKALVEQYGFAMAELPAEAIDINGDPRAMAELRMKIMDGCDLIIADTNDFRGIEPFAGSSFDLGYCYAMEKKLYCYMPDTRSCGDRYPGKTSVNERGRKVDEKGFSLESGTLNLMLDAPSTIVEGGLEDALKVAAKDYFGEVK
ncbi:MAG: nucleoside 2-deoxyribosyltransferase [Oscillospiraceae bacterium]|nr:nucleoside 2-deoxyribosyltransferase [Oscillospiraceae bacterium]